MADEVVLRSQEFEDSSGPGDDGLYDYHYAGWYYLLRIGDRIAYRVRRYRDTLEEAEFLTFRTPAGADDTGFTPSDRSFDKVPTDDPDFRAAAQHLIRELGVKKVTIFVPPGEYQEFRLS